MRPKSKTGSHSARGRGYASERAPHRRLPPGVNGSPGAKGVPTGRARRPGAAAAARSALGLRSIEAERREDARHLRCLPLALAARRLDAALVQRRGDGPQAR
jgi:hypothetical protein